MKIHETVKERLPVSVYETRREMGLAAAEKAAGVIRDILNGKGEANLIFAAAPSQSEMLEYLLKKDIDWSRIRGFHQDEYVGLAHTHPAGFGNFLRRHMFDLVRFKEVHYIGIPAAQEAEGRCAEYAELLRQFPPDLIFLGMGENGHVAFNDPPVADFNDPKSVKVVELDGLCRQQQVNDGCFASLEEVPTHAITLTMSLIMSVSAAVITVPSERKADAVRDALNGPVNTACPASILRRHPNAHLFLDKDSSEKAYIQESFNI